jgi:clan AA aspartic protease (TIGR02281 family)
VSIEDDGFHIFVEALINGRPARLLVDTGASRTVFDQEKIKDYLSAEHQFEENEKLSTGLGTNTMKSQVVVLDQLVIGRIVYQGFTAVVLDMQHVNQSFNLLGMEAITGVLGGDLLAGLNARIDYKELYISLEHLKRLESLKKSGDDE